ncbi:MAG: hypothetical protein HXX20_01200 [Chloroflexi bacterium]|nr:hypothetical protein [Chloroflexota bacterium]
MKITRDSVLLRSVIKLFTLVGVFLSQQIGSGWHKNRERVFSAWLIVLLLLPMGAVPFQMASAQVSSLNQNLIDDSRFGTNPLFGQQQIQDFLNSQPGSLKSYQSPYLINQTEPVAQVLFDTNIFYLINSQLLIVLMELQTGLITNQNPSAGDYQNPMKVAVPGQFFLDSLSNAADQLNNLAQNYKPGATINFVDGSTLPASSSINNGTYAIQAFLALYNTPADWEIKIGSGPNGFVSLFTKWFGDPTKPSVSASQQRRPNSIGNPAFPSLPWPYGGTGVITQGPSTAHDGGGGIDFYTYTHQITSIADGTVIQSKTNGENCDSIIIPPNIITDAAKSAYRVQFGNYLLIQYSGAFAGWYGYYYHLAKNKIYVTSGAVSAGTTVVADQGYTGLTAPCSAGGEHLHLQFVRDGTAYYNNAYQLPTCSSGQVSVNGHSVCGGSTQVQVLFTNNRPVALPAGDVNSMVDTAPVKCTHLWGWAWDPKSPNVSIYVDIYRDGPAGTGAFVQTVTANVYRSDVSSLVSHDNGLHGFDIPTPMSLNDGVDHTLYFYAIATGGAGPNPMLSNSPITINCMTNYAPHDLGATRVSSSEIDLFWGSYLNEDGFKIERKIGTNGTWSEIGTVAKGAYFYQDTSVQADSSYYFYRIRGYNVTGTSPYSNEARNSREVPLYVFWSNTHSSPFYTSYVSEANTVQTNGSTFNYARIAFYVYALNDCVGKVQVYRWYLNSNSNVHFYAAGTAERSAVNALGAWTEEGVWFCVYDTQMPGTLPVYRFYLNSDSTRHYYTTNEAEKNSLIAAGAWHYEFVAFYTLPTQINSLSSFWAVTSVNDRGQLLDSSANGTLSYALTQAIANDTVFFNGASTIQVTGKLPVVAAGAKIQGVCNANKSGVVINSSAASNVLNGLVLSGNNWLSGVKLTGFLGSAIKVATPSNHLSCVAVTK